MLKWFQDQQATDPGGRWLADPSPRCRISNTLHRMSPRVHELLLASELQRLYNNGRWPIEAALADQTINPSEGFCRRRRDAFAASCEVQQRNHKKCLTF